MAAVQAGPVSGAARPGTCPAAAMTGVPRYAGLGGVRVHYLEAGEGDPLLLLPGLGSSTRCSWAAIIALTPVFLETRSGNARSVRA